MFGYENTDRYLREKNLRPHLVSYFNLKETYFYLFIDLFFWKLTFKLMVAKKKKKQPFLIWKIHLLLLKLCPAVCHFFQLILQM